MIKNTAYILQEESVKQLYQKRLIEKLQKVTTRNDTEQEWKNMMTDILETSDEILGRKPIPKKKKKIGKAEEQEQQAYNNYL